MLNCNLVMYFTYFYYFLATKPNVTTLSDVLRERNIQEEVIQQLEDEKVT